MPCKKKRREKEKRKGVVGFFLLFVFLSVIIIFFFAFAIPVLIDLETAFYTAGEKALVDADDWVNEINNTQVKTQIQNTLTASQNSIPDQIDILGFFFQYSWIIFIIVILFVIYMRTRVVVESSGGLR